MSILKIQMGQLVKGIIIGIFLVIAEIVIVHEYTQAKMWTLLEARVSQIEQVQAIMVQTENKINKSLNEIIKFNKERQNAYDGKTEL